MITLTPNGRDVSSLTRLMRACTPSGDAPLTPRTPKPPASETAATNSGPATDPIPAERIGTSIPSTSQSGVRSATIVTNYLSIRDQLTSLLHDHIALAAQLIADARSTDAAGVSARSAASARPRPQPYASGFQVRRRSRARHHGETLGRSASSTSTVPATQIPARQYAPSTSVGQCSPR